MDGMKIQQIINTITKEYVYAGFGGFPELGPQKNSFLTPTIKSISQIGTNLQSSNSMFPPPPGFLPPPGFNPSFNSSFNSSFNPGFNQNGIPPMSMNSVPGPPPPRAPPRGQ